MPSTEVAWNNVRAEVAFLAGSRGQGDALRAVEELLAADRRERVNAMEVQPVLNAVQAWDISTGRARELIEQWLMHGTYDRPSNIEGPFPHDVDPNEAVAELRRQVEEAAGLAMAAINIGSELTTERDTLRQALDFLEGLNGFSTVVESDVMGRAQALFSNVQAAIAQAQERQREVSEHLQAFHRIARDKVPPAILKLARFGAAMFDQHRNDGYPGDVDGADLQEAALAAGLIEERTVNAPCGEFCTCVEAGDFPTTCYFTAPDVRAARDALRDPT